MTSALPDLIDHPTAWRGGDIGSKDGIAFDLTARHASALEALLQPLRQEGRGPAGGSWRTPDELVRPPVAAA